MFSSFKLNYRIIYKIIPAAPKIKKTPIRNYSVESTKFIPNLGSRTDKDKITPLGWFLLSIPITTFGLGCWQVKRKSWKENLIKELDEKTRMAPITLPENLDDIHNLEYRSVILKGSFIHDKELYIGPRSFIPIDGSESKSGLFSQQNQSNGFLVVTPFKLSNREETVLINRGWIPKQMINPKTREQGQVQGEIELVGIVRKGENRPQFSPDHRGQIYLYRDLERMCSETGADPIFIDANHNSTIIKGPVGGQTRVNLRNEHLSYIITWFSLSAATSYMWYQQIFKRSIK